jgi:predicted TPR repeat methyltransferase
MSRDGDVVGAVALLESEADLGLEGLGLLYMLVQRLGDTTRALACADRALTMAADDLPRSTWELRRGLCSLQLGQRADALAALQAVLRLRASDDHVAQAHQGLLALTDVQ